WLGLAVLVVCYAAGAGGLELLGVDLTTGYVPPHPVELVLYVAGEGLVLLTLGLLLSTRMAGMTGGIIALVVYLAAWIGGSGAGRRGQPVLGRRSAPTRAACLGPALGAGAVHAGLVELPIARGLRDAATARRIFTIFY